MTQQAPLPDREVWEVQTASQIVINVMKANRFGQAIADQLILGPNRIGARVEISPEDRRDNQNACADPVHDVFTNGMLLRVDASQQTDPETASPSAVSTEEALDILDLKEAEFKRAVPTLSEVTVRRLLELAESAGASHTKVVFLQKFVADTYRPGGPQTSLESGKGERLP